MSDNLADGWLDLRRRLAEATDRFEAAGDNPEKTLLGADVRELERLVEIAANEAAGSIANERSMTDYRAYIIGRDGHFKTFKIIVAADDEQAVDAARQFVDGCAVEVWELDRKVAVLPAEDRFD